MVAAVAAQYVHDFLLRRELGAYATDFTLEPATLVTREITEAALTQWRAAPTPSPLARAKRRKRAG
ncbi:MAG: hypothetical protein ACRDIB_13420 [Ardenticatenaceae bacterium]